MKELFRIVVLVLLVGCSPRLLLHAQGFVGSEFVVKSVTAEIALSVGDGLKWARIINKQTAADYLISGQGLPVFGLVESGTRISSVDFQATGETGSDGDGRVLVLEDKDRGWRAHLKMAIDNEGTALLGLRLENLKSEARHVQVIFPIVGPMSLGDEVEKLEYFFPWRSGVTGKVNCRLNAEYGNLAWMQVVAMYNQINGFYLFPKDPSGRFKGLEFRKSSGKGGKMVRHAETVLDRQMPRSALSFTQGAGVSYSYLDQTIGGRSILELPDTQLGIYKGNWREALKVYGSWVRTWYRKAPTPEWFKDSFTFVPAHPSDFWSDEKQRYIQSELVSGGEDVVQWAYWHDYRPENHPPSQSNVTYLEAANYGDYDYNVSRGGLKPFKDEIERLQAKGIRFTVYTNPRFCWQGSRIGRAKGKEWAAMYAPGEYGFYASEKDKWMMPVYDTTEWVDHFAETCGRLVRDTGMDGIYLDEMMLGFPDYHPEHTKNFGGDGPAPAGLLALGAAKIRAEVQKANPEGIVMTEHAGSDFFTQFIDGSWIQTYRPESFPFSEEHFDKTSLIFFRFVCPDFKLAEWGGSRDGVNRCFFNGIGGPYFQQRDLHNIQRENADAFNSLSPEPLIATGIENLLANRFPLKRKTIYTVYNKTGAAVDEFALQVAKNPGVHYVDLRNRRRLEFRDHPDGRSVWVNLEPAKVTAIAEFPRILEVERAGNNWAFSIQNEDPAGIKLVIGSLDSEEVKSVDLKEAKGEFPALPSGKAHIKLMRGEHLVDYWIEP